MFDNASRIVLATLAAATAAPHPAPQEFRYIFAERHALAPDVAHVAVYAGARSRAEVEAALSRHSIAPERVESWPIRGWWIAQLPERERTPERVRSLVGRLAQDPAFEFAAPVFVGDNGGPLFPAREVFVRFDPTLEASYARSLLGARGDLEITEERWADLPGAWRLTSRARDGYAVLRAANELALLPGALFAEADMVYTGSGSHIPNDPLFTQCWGLHNTGQVPGSVADVDMDAVEAWDLTTGDPSIVVAVLDVGVEQGHPDLQTVPGADVTTDLSPGGAPFNACDNHGTLVAGCISAVIDNQLGAVGSAPDCRVMSVRMLQSLPACDFNWTTTTGWVVAALTYAQQNGARVTNCSNGLMASASVASKYQAMHDAGIVHFASAGNNSSTSMHYPSTLPTVNGVCAVASNGTLASFSSYGPGLDLAAPGVNVPTTDRSGSAGIAPGDYVTVSGTSQAAPYAAGVAALVLSRNPALNAAQVDHVLRATATDLGTAGYDPQFGNGLVNARAALELAGTGCPAPASTCTAVANSTGAPALIGATGTTSVIADDLELSVTGCPASVNARFFFGSVATQAPFGNGFLCVAGPQTGLPVSSTNSFGDATQPLDLAALGLQAADTRFFQLVYRDPTASGATFNTSAALRVTFCP